MKLGYMTNGFGPLVGDGAGVTSVKDIRYLTLCDDEEVLRKVTKVGFRYIEVLEGNLTKYGGDIQVLKDMLARYDAGMMSVCVGANFIYQDALEDEMVHMETVAALAEQVGGFLRGLLRRRHPREGHPEGGLPAFGQGAEGGGKGLCRPRHRGQLPPPTWGPWRKSRSRSTSSFP